MNKVDFLLFILTVSNLLNIPNVCNNTFTGSMHLVEVNDTRVSEQSYIIQARALTLS